MKKILFIISLALLSATSYTQTTADNFNCNDCTGANHDLFSDLNSGKVVVLIWVMPCASCINAALTAQTEVQNARALNPGRIVYYLCDDNGGTSCSTLSSWAAQNGITAATVISNSKVSMTPYGDPGMPKLIVMGGTQHMVYYNQNEPDIAPSGIRDGIAAALAAPLGLRSNVGNSFSIKLYPNPAKDFSKIGIELTKMAPVRIEVMNNLGQCVFKLFSGTLLPGSHNFDLNTSDFTNGTYYVKVSDCEKSSLERIIVFH